MQSLQPIPEAETQELVDRHGMEAIHIEAKMKMEEEEVSTAKIIPYQAVLEEVDSIILSEVDYDDAISRLSEIKHELDANISAQ